MPVRIHLGPIAAGSVLAFAIAVAPHAQQQQSTSRNSPSRIEIPVTVMDADGQLVTGLVADRFRLYVDDRQQPITAVTADERIPGMAMMLGPLGNPSAHYDERRSAVRAAMLHFTSRLHPDTDVGLQLYPNSVFQNTGDRFPSGPFRQLKAAHLDDLEQVLANGRGLPGEKTLGELAMWPLATTLYGGMRVLERMPASRKAILYFNDGTESLADVSAVNNLADGYSQLAGARKTGVEIYAVAVLPSAEDYYRWPRLDRMYVERTHAQKPDLTALEKVATDTGGAWAIASSQAELLETVERFAREIRGAYTLTFDAPGDRKSHQVRVEVDGGYTVRTRPAVAGSTH